MKISAIIPAYNAAPYIQRAVRSCLNISELLEVIVIDDGSTDATGEILGSIIDDRLLVLRHSDGKNHGRSAARNLGIKTAAGDWIIFCDADDFCLPHRVAHLIHKNHNNIDGYYDLIEARTEDPELSNNDILNHQGIQEEVPAKELIDHLVGHRESWFNLTGLTIRKSAIQKIGYFDKSLTIAEDTDLIWRLALSTTLLSGGARSPIAVRWVHRDNSYHDLRDLTYGRYAFYKKWKRILPDLTLSTTSSNRIKSSYSYYRRKKIQEQLFAWFQKK